MAALCKHVVSDISVFSRKVMNGAFVSAYNRQGVRYLYSQGALGIDSYVKTREKVHTQFVNMADKFRLKMHEFSEPESTNLIFTEDLKHMVHLIEPNQDDLNLIIKMMRRFNQQNKQLRFGNYVFGPVVMRMFHFLDQPESAYEAFKDPEMEGFFDQLMSYQILLDLLYRNEMYQKVIEIFELIKGKQIQSTKYPKNVIVLTLAACYKMNTPESLKYAADLWKELQNVGHFPMRRAATFTAALALNQNSPHISLEIISGVKQQNYVTVRNIKAAALADIGRPEDSIPILRSVLEIDNPTVQKQTFTKDVMLKIKQAVKRRDDKDLSYEFQQLEKRLIEQGHISETALDDYLCSEIVNTQNNTYQTRDRRFLAASFNRERGSDQGRSYVRPGLKDLY